MNSTYRWDPAEGIVGVLGVAPTATIDFYQRLSALTPARKDWEHVRVLIDSNPKLPSRGRHLELGEADPSPFIRAGIDALLAQGAAVVAIPCNTAHILYPRYAAGIEARVPHMIAETITELVAINGGAPRRLAVLGSRHTIAYDLYGARLRPLGGDCCPVGHVHAEISALIEMVKQGGDLVAAAARLRRVMESLSVADAFAVACTELSALAEQAWVQVPVVDANEVLARVCLQRVRSGSVPSRAGTSTASSVCA